MSFLRKRWAGRGGWRDVVHLAFPLILSTGSWSVQQFIDRVFLAWYSPEAIAAAVPANLLNFSIMCLFIGTASYAGTFVAQYFGAGRFDRIGPAVWQGVHLSLVGGLVVLSLIPLAEPVFQWIGHDPGIQALEVDLFSILCLGGFPVIGAAAVSGFFAGRGRPWPVMWVNVSSMMLNVVLNYALIFGNWGFPEMGIRGAGWATVISASFAFAVFMVLMITPENNRIYGTVKGWRPEKDLLVRLLRFGLPSGVEFFMDLAGFTIFVLLIGRLGTVSLAATNIALNINMFAFMPMLGTGMAISVLVGQYVGAERPDLAERSVYSGFQMTLLYMGSIAAGYMFLPGVFIAPFTAQADSGMYPDIFALAVVLLRFVAVYSLFDAANIIFVSGIKGAGDTRFAMLVLGSYSLFLLALPTFLAVVVFGWSLMTCWAFVTGYIAVLGTTFYLRFRGGKWKKMRVIETTSASTAANMAGMPADD